MDNNYLLPMAAHKNNPADGHPISVVVRRTGLTQDILRAWERRYRAVVPLRTPTGRRFYTEDQVQKLRLLKQLVDGGRRISDVADRDLEDLRILAAEDASEAVVDVAPAPRRAAVGLLASCLDAVDRLDRLALEQALEAAAVALSRPRLRSEILVPLIHELGERWHAGSWRIVHEHVASAVLRSFLWSMWRRVEPGADAPAVVVATPLGQRHELGALLVAGIAADLGWRVVYLGCDLPAEEIAVGVQASRASAVLLSLIHPQPDSATIDDLRRLRQVLGRGFPLLAGGRAALAGRDELSALGLTVVEDLGDLGAVLDSLGRGA
jgi:MerR family transcriptional regulator, light-induced transcriptional regulator